MKKLVLIALFTTLAVGVVSAQSSAPVTSITAVITVEKQVVKTGPYARFAQKFLGAVAPLADKEIYTITDAMLSEGDAYMGVDEPILLPERSQSHIYNDREFTKVQIDRRDLTTRSLEDAAQVAANQIFALRKARVELITGMAGENVFGQGLRDALRELDKLEEEYLSLFMGKQSLQTIVKTYKITPAAGEANRVVCRFSESEGLLPESDLTASPIMLDMKVVSKPAPAPTGKQPKNAPPMVRTYEPAVVNCRLTDGKKDLASLRASIYQMGSAVMVPAE